MAEHHALRRAGRAGGVDDGEQVARRSIAPRRPSRSIGGRGDQVCPRRSCPCGASPSTTTVRSSGASAAAARTRSAKSPASTIATPALQWLDEVGDLLRRRGVVDRDRSRPARKHRQVRDVELQPVAQHQDDPVACGRPRARQALRRTSRPGRRTPSTSCCSPIELARSRLDASGWRRPCEGNRRAECGAVDVMRGTVRRTMPV